MSAALLRSVACGPRDAVRAALTCILPQCRPLATTQQERTAQRELEECRQQLSESVEVAELLRQRLFQATCANHGVPPPEHALPPAPAMARALSASDAALALTIWPVAEGGEELLEVGAAEGGGGARGGATSRGGGEAGPGRGALAPRVSEQERAYIYAAAASAAAPHASESICAEVEVDGVAGWEVVHGIAAPAQQVHLQQTGGSASREAGVEGGPRSSGTEMAALDMLRTVRSGGASAGGRSVLGGRVVGGEGGRVTHSEMTLVLLRYLQAPAARPGCLPLCCPSVVQALCVLLSTPAHSAASSGSPCNAWLCAPRARAGVEVGVLDAMALADQVFEVALSWSDNRLLLLLSNS